MNVSFDDGVFLKLLILEVFDYFVVLELLVRVENLENYTLYAKLKCSQG